MKRRKFLKVLGIFGLSSIVGIETIAKEQGFELWYPPQGMKRSDFKNITVNHLEPEVNYARCEVKMDYDWDDMYVSVKDENGNEMIKNNDCIDSSWGVFNYGEPIKIYGQTKLG